MRHYIDAHVHLTPETALGTKNERFGTEVMPYGYLKKPDGGFYTMPPFLAKSCFTMDTLIAVMDAYGVDKAVILQSLMSPQNEYVAQAVEKYPDRLAGAMVIEPLPGWEKEMEYWYSRGLHIIKFEMRAYSDPACYPDIGYDDERILALFRKAAEMDMTITIDPAPVDFPVYQPEALHRAVEKIPEGRFVLCHMGYPMPINTPELKKKWECMMSVASHPNCWLDVSAMPDLFDAEGWPYPTALSLLAKAKEVCGADKLIWGTDITGSLNRATYPQMRDMFLRADCMTPGDLDKLFSENAEKAYRL